MCVLTRAVAGTDRFAAKAGTALLFGVSCEPSATQPAVSHRRALCADTGVWHTPMPNTSNDARRTFNLGWCSSINGQMDTGAPSAQFVGLREAMPERFTPELCALLGLGE